MLSSPALAAILRHLADEVEKVEPAPVEVPINPISGYQAGLPNQTAIAAAAPDPPQPAPLPQTPPPVAAPPPPAPAASPKPMIDLTTTKGIQQAFNQIRTKNFPQLEENGVLDGVMAFALKEFQATAGIPVTGAIDETTINTLHKAIFGTPRT